MVDSKSKRGGNDEARNRIRVAKKMLKHLRVTRQDLAFLLDPETVFVHPQVSAYLRENVPFDDPPAAMETFYASDYHPVADVDAFCEWMDAHVVGKTVRNRLNVAFAVDGFRGEQLRHYRDRLRYALRESVEEPDWEEESENEVAKEAHARAVRLLHESHGPMRPEAVRIVVQNVLDKNGEGFMTRIGQTYRNALGSLFDRVKEYLEKEYVCFEEAR